MPYFQIAKMANAVLRKSALDGFYSLVKVPHMATKQVFESLTFIRNIKELATGESLKYSGYFHIYLKFHDNTPRKTVKRIILEHLKVRELDLEVVPCTSKKVKVIKGDSLIVLERGIKTDVSECPKSIYVVTINAGVVAGLKKCDYGASMGLFRRLQRDSRIQMLHIRSCPLTRYIKLHIGFNEEFVQRDVVRYFEDLFPQTVYFVEPIPNFPNDLKFEGNIHTLNVYESQADDVTLCPLKEFDIRKLDGVMYDGLWDFVFEDEYFIGMLGE